MIKHNGKVNFHLFNTIISVKSCVLKNGFTAKYLNLEECARKGDTISAYLFILALEIFFTYQKRFLGKRY